MVCILCIDPAASAALISTLFSSLPKDGSFLFSANVNVTHKVDDDDESNTDLTFDFHN